MADELNLEKTMELMVAAGISESDCRMAYAGHGLTLKLERLRDFAQAARRAAPAAAQLDADNLPPRLSNEQIGQMYLSTRHIGHATNRELAFARAVEEKVVAPYAERIRLLERELKATRTVSDHHFDTILELRANIDGRTAGTASEVARERIVGCRYCGVHMAEGKTCWNISLSRECKLRAQAYAAAPSTQENAK